MHDAVDPRDLLSAEIDQRRETGHDPGPIEAQIASAGGIEALTDDEATRLLEETEGLQRRPEWPYEEPDALPLIKDAASWPKAEPVRRDDHDYPDAVRRAWHGRIAGNMLGKPVESGDAWTWTKIKSFLTEQDAWPLTDYFPDVADTGPEHPAYLPNAAQTTRGRVTESSRDDDVDYTVLNLHLLRKFGPAFRTADVAEAWLTLLPYRQTYTAERVAIRNLISGVAPERAGSVRNPYREWIGAAIRADVFGYISPGDPGRAAELAWTDAVLSHVGNGIYGEMWCAALVAAAFTAESAADALETSLGVVPVRSRLRQAIEDTRDWHDAGLSWEQTRTKIDDAYGQYGWVHMINNAAVLTAGLLYGDGDFGRSIALTVCGGWDTDSNGATAGSVAGLLARRIEPHWTAPLHDTVRSAVFGYDRSSITELAADTVDVARRS